jgi:hypothetical protein
MNQFDTEFIDHTFSKSFQRRALKIWAGLSAPYSKLDDTDFIASGDEDIADNPYPIFERPTQSVEDEFVKHLRRKIENERGRKHGYDSSSSDDQDAASKCEDDSDDEVIIVNENDDEDIYIEESSEDEWLASKRSKRREKKPARLRSKRSEKVHSDSDEDAIFSRKNTRNRAIKPMSQLSSSDDELKSDGESNSCDEPDSDEHSSSSDESKDSSEYTPWKEASKKVVILASDED